MNDLEILRTLAGPDPMPNPAAETKARAALLALAAAATPVPRRSRSPRRTWVFRVAAPAAAVAAAIAVLGVVKANDETVRPSPPATRPVLRPVSAVQALGYAADAATRQPFTVPRGDQWFYQETRSKTGTGPGGVVTGGPYRTETSKVWRRIDGTQSVREMDGKLVSTPMANAPLRKDGAYDYATLAALPPTPAAVLAWVRQQVGGVGGGTRDGEDQIAFATMNGVLRNNVLPPAVEAAFFHALASLSGVTLVPDAVNVDGRPALAVARVEEGWLRDEILLDPETYRLIGERAIAIADHTGTGDDGTWKVRKGTVERQIVRIAAAIVDRPGQTG